MEVNVLTSNAIPDGSILSIRAGTIRRQAPFFSGRPLKFPAKLENPLKIDVFQPVATGYVVVRHGEDQYKVNFPGQDDMNCELEVKAGSGGPSVEPVDDEPPGKRQEGAAAAKDYLEKFAIPEFVQAVLQTVIKEKPADPYAAMARHFLSGYKAPEERSKLTQPAEAAPKEEANAEPPAEEAKPAEEAPQEAKSAPPAEEAKSAEEAPKEEAMPAEEAPKEEAAPAAEAPKEEAAPAEDYDYDYAPAEEAPKEEAQPAEEAPTEEAKPAEEAPKEEASMSSEPVEQFIAVTCASPEDAKIFVEGAKNDVEQAIQIFFEVEGDAKKASWEFFGGRQRHEEEERQRQEEERRKAEEEARLRREQEEEERRRVEEEAMKAEAKALGSSREDRIKRLTLHLLSSAVQMPAAEGVQEIAATLTSDEVASVFKKYAPGVEEFLYRGQAGKYSLPFMQSAYADGLQAFRNTPVHNHLLWLLRLVVHSGHEERPGVNVLVRQVAEAFMDCQAVQARVIEHAGLQLAGVALDYRGLVIKLVGEYKIIAVKTLTYLEHKDEDADPAHYENRLTADLGDALGLNKNDMQQAELDQHANSRFPRLGEADVKSLAKKARELFDFDAMLHAFVTEVNSFSAESPPESLPCLFLQWANEQLTQQHVVFDEDTCSFVDVGQALALAILEFLFLGTVYAPADELYRDEPLMGFFPPEAAPQEEIAETNQFFFKPSVGTWHMRDTSPARRR